MPDFASYGDIPLTSLVAVHEQRCAFGRTVGAYRIFGASVAGQDHVRRGLPRDDAFVVGTCGPWIAVGICDGLGSRPLSRFGASCVAESLVRRLLQTTTGAEAIAAAKTPSVGGTCNGRRFLRRSRELLQASRAICRFNLVGVRHLVCATAAPSELHISMKQSFAQAKEDLLSHAKNLGASVEELGCTALAILLNMQTGQAVAGQIGDGAVLQLSSDDSLNEVVDTPETDDPQATFVIGTATVESALRVVSFCVSPGEKNAAIFVMTDGLSHDLLFTGRRDQAATWAKSVNRLLSEANDLSQATNGMLIWLDDYRKPGNRDDRTLVVITCGNDGDNHR